VAAEFAALPGIDEAPARLRELLTMPRAA
jgi:hypothetical protein